MADDSDSHERFDDIYGDEYKVIDDVVSEDEEKDGEEKDGEEKDGEEKSENAASSKKATRKSKHIFPSKDNPVSCNVCSTLFTRKDALIAHKATHTGIKPFICKFPSCGKAYQKARYLRDHKRSHTGKKPFVCKLCNKAFARSHEHTLHVRAHAGEKPYKCVACGKCYVKSRYLREHKRNCKERKTADETTSKDLGKGEATASEKHDKMEVEAD